MNTSLGIQTEEVGSRKLVIGDAHEKAMLVIRAAIEAHSEMQKLIHAMVPSTKLTQEILPVSSRLPAMAFYDAQSSLRGFHITARMLHL